jgi:biotin operon repressor
MERETQRDRVLAMLRAGDWVSIPQFLAAGISRFGARIFELRRQGYEIEAQEEHKGHSRHVKYRLTPKGQGRLF